MTTVASESIAIDGKEQTVQCVYFFSGEARKGDIGCWLKEICRAHGFILQIQEFDLLREPSHDLSSGAVQNQWIKDLCKFQFVICTPPCSGHSRIVWANSFGPHPVRSAQFPTGFPWLSNSDRIKADYNEGLVNFMWSVFDRVEELRLSQAIVAFGEHPEDLGRVKGAGPGSVPASIWRSERFAKLRAKGWWSGALRQCDHGAPTPKPTRCVGSDDSFTVLAPDSWPVFDPAGFYVGPVVQCSHDHTESLLRKRSDTGVFRSAKAAAYPSAMCKVIAQCLFNSYSRQVSSQIPSVGVALICKDAISGTGVSLPVKPLVVPKFPPDPPSVPCSKWNVLRNKLADKILEVKLGSLSDPPAVETSYPSTSTSDGRLVEEILVSKKWDLVEGVDFLRQGHWGNGPPISTLRGAGVHGRPFQDGGGLCCPGRWTMQSRVLPANAAWFTASLDSWLVDWAGSEGETALQNLVFKIVSGRCESSPFAGLVAQLKFSWASFLAKEGLQRPLGRVKKGQLIDFGGLFMIAKYLGDPDFDSMAEMCAGARVGVGIDLKRTLAVWPPKTKWPLPDYGVSPVYDLNDNYPSAKVYKEELKKELQDQLDRGWAVRMNLKDAQLRFGKISVAPLSIILERSGKFRTLLDASNRVQINHRIRVVDSEQCPTSLDVQAAVSADGDLRRPLVSLVIDIEKAHQQIPTDERDWGHVACAEQEKPLDASKLGEWELHLKTVGTYGVASASWNWARVGSLFQRLSYYICQVQYLFRFADDFLLVACSIGGTRFTRIILRFLLLCEIYDIPIKWAKTRGGLRCEFVGYLFLWESLEGGLSERRCDWLCGWTRKVAADGIIVARDLRAGLGRFAFSAALLRYLLPFLGPFYAWVAVLPDSAAWPLPEALLLLLEWLAVQLEKRHLVPLRIPKVNFLGRFFKADAKAEGSTVVVGGYEVCPGASLASCRWYSFDLDPVSAPWAFVREGEAYRTIATLELFASLLCIMLFVGFDETCFTTHLTMVGVSDNKGNEALVKKNLTSKFPLYVILLELTEQLQIRNMSLDLRWQPREENEAADALTNHDFKDFSEQFRIKTTLSQLEFLVLPKLLEAAHSMHVQILKRKAEAPLAAQRLAGRGKRKKRKPEGLRTTDPW